MSDKKGLIGWALVVVAIVAAAFLGVRFPIPEAPEDVVADTVRPVQFRSVHVQQDLSVGGDVSVDGSLALDGMYPALSVNGGSVLEVGATGAISRTAVVPMAIATVEAFGCQVRSPAVAAWHCGVQIGAGNRITMTIYNLAATPIATPHAAGANYWVAGSR